MQTLRIGRAVLTLSPMRNVAELQAQLAKPYRLKKRGEKRLYPVFQPGWSTADYVDAFEALNNGNGYRSTRYLKHGGFFAELNTAPCTLYSGEDSHEIIADDSDELPAPIEARELTGAEADAVLREFADLALAA